MKKRVFFSGLLSITVLLGVGLFLYIDRAPRTTHEQDTQYKLQSIMLKELLEEEGEAGLDSLINTIVELEGVCTSKTDSTLILEDWIFIQTTEKLEQVALDQKVRVKGKCVGYDDLLQELKITQAYIVP